MIAIYTHYMSKPFQNDAERNVRSYGRKQGHSVHEDIRSRLAYVWYSEHSQSSYGIWSTVCGISK